MDINKILEEEEGKLKKEKEYLNSLSEEEKNGIKEKELNISYKIKELLDKKGIAISDIKTSFHKNYETKDNQIIDAFHTIYTSTYTQRASSVVTNAKMMEMLYVRTGINKYHSIEDFFGILE